MKKILQFILPKIRTFFVLFLLLTNLSFANDSLAKDTTSIIKSRSRFSVSTQPLLLTDLIPNIEFDLRLTSKLSLSINAAYINVNNWLFDLDITTVGTNINYHFEGVGNNSLIIGTGAEAFYGELDVFGYSSDGLGFFPNLSTSYKWYTSSKISIEAGLSVGISQPLGFLNIGYTFF